MGRCVSRDTSHVLVSCLLEKACSSWVSWWVGGGVWESGTDLLHELIHVGCLDLLERGVPVPTGIGLSVAGTVSKGLRKKGGEDGER